jgi:hypothetical protein
MKEGMEINIKRTFFLSHFSVIRFFYFVDFRRGERGSLMKKRHRVPRVRALKGPPPLPLPRKCVTPLPLPFPPPRIRLFELKLIYDLS